MSYAHNSQCYRESVVILEFPLGKRIEHPLSPKGNRIELIIASTSGPVQDVDS